MAIDPIRLAQMLLVASDQSYAGNLIKPLVGQPGAALAVFQDGPPNTNFQPPYPVTNSGFVVADTIQNDATGFKSVVYRNDAANEIIVAMAGTDGSDLRDWWGNVTHYGWNQWKENRVAVLQAIDQLIAELGASGTAPGIHFTGQSLGGALAQYAAYEFAETHEGYPRANLSLVTFNGLGAVAALRDEIPNRGPLNNLGFPGFEDLTFDASRVAGFGAIAHYSNRNDLVSRIGAGHLGGNVLVFPGQDFSKLNPNTGAPYLLDTVNAHKLETGFYYPLTQYAALTVDGFAAAVSGGPLSGGASGTHYLKIDGLQKVASIAGNVFRQSETTKPGALAKLLFGGLGGIVLGDSKEINGLVGEYVETRLRAGFYEGKQLEYEAAKDTDWAARLRIGAAALGASTVARWNPFGLLVRLAGAIALAPVYKLIEGVSNDDGEFVLRNAFQLQGQPNLVPDSTVEETLERSALIGAALRVPDPRAAEQRLATVAELAEEDLEGFAAALVTGGSDWYRSTANYLVSRGNQLGKQDRVAAALSEFWTYSRQAAGGNATLLASVAEQSTQFTTDWKIAAAKVSDDLAEPGTTPLEVTGLAPFAQKRSFWTSVLGGLEAVLDLFVGTAHAETTRAAAVAAAEEVRDAAQKIVVTPGREANPFDAPDFDPDTYLLPSAQLAEGSVRTLTAYLPYEAGEGGQRIEFTLTGTAAEDLSVLSYADALDLEADGTFTLTIAEGQREVSFGLLAGADIDADATLSLSAQLVDAAGEATHLEHEEATIALDGESEAAPSGGREIRGDWAPKPYTDPNTGETYYEWEVLGDTFGSGRNNIERLPGTPNTTGFQEPDGKLDGSVGADHIVTGDYEYEAYGFGGDDSIEGSDLEGSIFFGGAGNDWLEAGGYTDHAADYFEFTYLGQTIKLGEDKLYGGAGNDFIFGESADTLDTLYDEATTPSNRPGDWAAGGSGSDEVYGGAGDDVLMGGAGEDLLIGGAGMDVLLGDDDLHLRAEGNFWRVLHPNFGDTDARFGGFEVGLFPVVNATLAFPDLVFDQTGDPDFVYYRNGGADDVLMGGAGKDILIGQSGDDTLYGGEGDDIAAGWEGADVLYGGEGNDLMAGEFGRYEQENQRIVDGTQLVRAGVFNANGTYGGAPTLVGNDYLDGGGGNDTLWGEGGNDTVLGGDGSDILYGDAFYLPGELHGNDLLDGGKGDDSLYGSGGNDRLLGGDGSDSLFGGEGNDRLEGGAGDDILLGEAGDDILVGGGGVDQLEGGDGNDQLRGGDGADALLGGEGNDSLHGEAGVDTLQGGAGADTLYGGGGEDVIDGGDGDDTIDGGAGIDIVRGGGGDDTYLLDFGYGADIVEDSEGKSNFMFGAGILAQDLSATLDAATLSATVNYGLPGDTVTVNLADSQLGTLSFADGATWERIDLLRIVPTLVSQGSAAGETLFGNESVRNDLQGGDGDDTVYGSGNEDVLAGGNGNDTLDGGAGGDRYVFTADEVGIDQLAESDQSGRAYVEGYYAGLGISDWELRGQHGGEYRLDLDGPGDYYATFEAADAVRQGFGYGEIVFIEPLPSFPPLVRRDDVAGVEGLIASGAMGRDTVEFGAGLAVSDVAFRLQVDASGPAATREQLLEAGGALTARWSDGYAGFDLTLAGANYGYSGPNLAAAPDSYLLGTGIETFEFADGSSYSMDEVLEQAGIEAFGSEGGEFLTGWDTGSDILHGQGGDDTLDGGAGDDLLDGGEGADAYVLRPGGGRDIVEAAYILANEDRILAGAGLEATDILFSRNYGDLTAWIRGTQDRIELRGWFSAPQFRLAGIEFDGGAFLDADQMEAALEPAPGTVEDDVIFGSPGDDQIDALGGNDEVLANEGNDTVQGGDGDDYLEGGQGLDVLRGGAGDDELGDYEDANVLDGGAGADYLSFEGANFVAGGTGDDFIEAFGVDSVVAFNLGDGADTVYAGEAFTLSLGGGIAAGDLVLSQDGEDLVLAIGATDSIRLTREFEADPQAWPQITLQLFGSVHTFDFNGVIAEFQAARAADPQLQMLPIGNILEAHRTGFSETEALGGALAWQYATTGSLEALSEAQIREVLGDAGFGAEAQPTGAEPPVNHAPVVSAADAVVFQNRTVQAASLYSVADADGDAIVQYEFRDEVEGGGYFSLNGVQQGAGQAFVVSAADLANARYVGGSGPGVEQVGVRASDGSAWGEWKYWNLTSAPRVPNAAPVVTSANATLLLNSTESAANIFSATDADDEPVLSYAFYDKTPGGGHFAIDGVEVGVNVVTTVPAAALADIVFVASDSIASDLIWVRAFDGQSWGDWKSGSIGSWLHIPNAAPVVAASNANVLLDDAVAAASLFSATDADSDPILHYQFYDSGAGGGHFAIDGVAAGAQLVIPVSAAQLANTHYVAGSGVGVEKVMVRASDGMGWSAWQYWNITSALHIPNAAPQVMAANSSVLLDDAVAAASLFTAADADNDVITLYEFWDKTAGNGHFTVNGVQAGENVAIPVSAADLANTEFVAAGVIGSDQVLLRVSDGMAWSSFKSWTVSSVAHLTNTAPVVSAANNGLLRGETVSAASLFAVTDADGDAITQVKFWDDVNGGGQWRVDGAPQAAGQAIVVAAADLADTVYVGGANPGTEQVWVSAFDGMAWSNWKNWLMSTEGGLVLGGVGPDTLTGDPDTLILQGGGGGDTLTAGDSNSLLDGGEGGDTLNGGAANDLLIGGAGDDILHTGGGSNLIAYNAGDGADTVYSAAGSSNTLSLGGGLRYQDLSLSKSGDDLVLDTGGGNQLTFRDWYAGHDDVLTLQMVIDASADFDAGSSDPLANRRVQSFDFAGMVSAFDAARAGDPGLSSWALTNALLQYHLAGADEAALGGDLAYQYGSNDTLAGIGLTSALDVLSSGNFGALAQQLRPLSGLQEGFSRLS